MAGIGLRMSSDRKQDSVNECRERRPIATSAGMAGTATTSTGTETDDRPGQRKRARVEESITKVAGEASRSGELGQVGYVPPPVAVPRPVVFGYVSVAGRLREMEDTVCVKPQFFRLPNGSYIHFFAVFDGHGGSHVIFLNFSFFFTNKKNIFQLRT